MSQKPILVKKTMLTLNNFIAFTILPQKSNLLVFLLVVNNWLLRTYTKFNDRSKNNNHNFEFLIQ